MYEKGAVVRHKVTGNQGVVLKDVLTGSAPKPDAFSGHVVEVDVAVGMERWPSDLVELVSAPVSSDLLKRLANLEERVAKLEALKQ
jgi:hypothetical protein